MDYTVDGILQARILEWVAFPFSTGVSQPRDWTQVSRIAGRFFTSWATREAHCSKSFSLKSCICRYGFPFCLKGMQSSSSQAYKWNKTNNQNIYIYIYIAAAWREGVKYRKTKTEPRPPSSDSNTLSSTWDQRVIIRENYWRKKSLWYKVRNNISAMGV